MTRLLLVSVVLLFSSLANATALESRFSETFSNVIERSTDCKAFDNVPDDARDIIDASLSQRFVMFFDKNTQTIAVTNGKERDQGQVINNIQFDLGYTGISGDYIENLLIDCYRSPEICKKMVSFFKDRVNDIKQTAHTNYRFSEIPGAYHDNQIARLNCVDELADSFAAILDK